MSDASAKLPKVFLIYQPTDGKLLDIVQELAKKKFEVLLAKKRLETQPLSNFWAKVRHLFASEGESYDLVVAMMLPDSRSVHGQGNGWLELGAWLGWHGDHRVLVLRHADVAMPVPLVDNVELNARYSSKNSSVGAKLKLAKEVVQRIETRLDNDKEHGGDDPKLKVLIIESGVTVPRRPSAALLTLIDELNGKEVPTADDDKRTISVGVLAELMDLPATGEYGGSPPNSLLRLKAIINRFDLAIYLIGSGGDCEASKGGLGCLALGYWAGRGHALSSRVSSGDHPELLVASADLKVEVPSDLKGVHLIDITVKGEVLKCICQFVSAWGNREAPSKSGPHIRFLRQFGSLDGWSYDEFSETGLASARFPNDMLAPSMAIIYAQETQADALFTVSDAVRFSDAWTCQVNLCFKPYIKQGLQGVPPKEFTRARLVDFLRDPLEELRGAVSEVSKVDLERLDSVRDPEVFRKALKKFLSSSDRLLTQIDKIAKLPAENDPTTEEQERARQSFVDLQSRLEALDSLLWSAVCGKHKSRIKLNAGSTESRTLLRDMRCVADQFTS